ncbi:MAG: hypothetical protein P1U34_08645 [Coxiellaceae bacterium]|nr:hypothetical protein [Coxiellaceae bacterium]
MRKETPAFIDTIPVITASLLQPTVERSEVVAAIMAANTADYMNAIKRIADPELQQQAKTVIFLHLMILSLRAARIVTPKLQVMVNKLYAQVRVVLESMEPELVGKVMNLQFDISAITDADKEIFNGLLTAGAFAHAKKVAVDLFSKPADVAYDMADKENVLMLIECIAHASGHPVEPSADIAALASSITAVLTPPVSETDEDDVTGEDDHFAIGGLGSICGVQ